MILGTDSEIDVEVKDPTAGLGGDAVGSLIYNSVSVEII